MPGNKSVSAPDQAPLHIIHIHAPIIYPSVKSRIYISDIYEDLICQLLDTKGYFILSYFIDQEGQQIYPTASIVSIEDYDKQASGFWELQVKGQGRVILTNCNVRGPNPTPINDYLIYNYVDEEFISPEEEENIKEALQLKLKKNFPNMPPYLYGELMEDFSIAKFLHYLCFSTKANRDIKIELLSFHSLYELYQHLIDGFMK